MPSKHSCDIPIQPIMCVRVVRISQSLALLLLVKASKNASALSERRHVRPHISHCEYNYTTDCLAFQEQFCVLLCTVLMALANSRLHTKVAATKWRRQFDTSHFYRKAIKWDWSIDYHYHAITISRLYHAYLRSKYRHVRSLFLAL